MQIHRFLEDARPERLERADSLPEKGFLWMDFVREEAPDWAERVRELTGVRIFDAHISDSLSARHPSFFDETDDYEMLIFRELTPNPDPLLTSRLRQHPWDPSVSWTGNAGDHDGALRSKYLRAYVLPLLDSSRH